MRGKMNASPEEQVKHNKLDELLGGEKKDYVAISREEIDDKKEIGRYRMYGNVGSPGEIVAILLNFLDGMLEDDDFLVFCQLTAKRAVDRLMVMQAKEQKKDGN